MHNPKSTAPLVVIVCPRTSQCENLVESIRELAPSMRVGMVAHCYFQKAMRNLFNNHTPLVGIIQVNPKATGHVDIVPSGVAQNLMNIARSCMPFGKVVEPTFILCTDAKDEDVQRMKRPISPLSGIHPSKIHVVRPDAPSTAETIIKILNL